MERDDADMQRIDQIRAETRARLARDAFPGLHRAVFYSGTYPSVGPFCAWLATKRPAYAGAKNLEQLGAAQYLMACRDELVRLFGSDDFDVERPFRLGSGNTVRMSINGLWRELSASFARAARGVVHVLVTHERTRLHQRSIEFWARRGAGSRLPSGLRVFGAIELPILVGLLSDNTDVRCVNIYVEPSPGRFELVQDSQLVIHPAAGNA